MNITNLVKAMPDLYAQRSALFMTSAPGCAKSSMAKEACNILSVQYDEAFGFVDIVMPTIDSPDIRGYVVPVKQEGGATCYYTKSPIIQLIEDTGCARGVLLLDEFAASDQSVQKACAEIILERKIGEHHLPDGWWVVIASNRSKDKAGASRMLSHITNRIINLEVTLDVDAWVGWAVGQKMHPMAVAFAKARPGAIFSGEVPKNPDAAFCTPRSFTKAMEFIALKAGFDNDGNPIMDIPIDNISAEIVNGFIGDAVGSELMAYFKCAELMPTYDEMMADPEGCKLPPGSRLDAQYGVSAMIVHYAVSDNVGDLFKVANRLVKELQTSTVLDLLKKSGGTLMNSTALNKWVSENRALISASM